MAKKGNRFVRKQGAAKGPLILMLLVVVVVLIFAVLMYRQSEREEAKSPPVREAIPRRTLPPRQQPAQPEPGVTIEPKYESPEQEPDQSPPPVKGEGKLAIIIDDMGSSMEELRTFLSMKTPITFSVIPGLAKDAAVAESAHAQGYEVMVHMPMEPQGYPKQRLEKNGLLVSMPDLEIESRVSDYIRAVPHADGANNHMGSRFTEVREKMTPALRVLNGSGLFFIDSRTSPASVGCSVARELGMKAGGRQVFLDNVQNVAAIRKQLNQAAAIARKRGGAVAIGHPHRATMQALAAAIPVLKSQGITFVFARDMVN